MCRAPLNDNPASILLLLERNVKKAWAQNEMAELLLSYTSEFTKNDVQHMMCMPDRRYCPNRISMIYTLLHKFFTGKEDQAEQLLVEAAKDLFYLAAEQNFSQASFRLGQLFEIRKDYSLAKQWYEHASTFGPAMHSLALLYKKGAFIDINKVLSGEHAVYDVEKRLSKEKALSIYCQLSALGDTKAQRVVSNHALFGHTNACSLREMEDAAWFPLYSSIAQCALGTHLIRHGDGERERFKQEHKGQASLWRQDEQRFTVNGVEQHHKDQAMFWYELSAAQGNTKASLCIAHHLMLNKYCDQKQFDDTFDRVEAILLGVISKEDKQGGDERMLGQALFMLASIGKQDQSQEDARTASLKSLKMLQRSSLLGNLGGEELFFELSELVRRDETLRNATLCCSVGDRVHASGFNERTRLNEWVAGTVLNTKIIDESTGLIVAAYCIELDSPSSCFGQDVRTVIYSMHDNPNLIRPAPRFCIGNRVRCCHYVYPEDLECEIIDEWQTGVIVGHHLFVGTQMIEVVLDSGILVFVANDSEANIQLEVDSGLSDEVDADVFAAAAVNPFLADLDAMLVPTDDETEDDFFLGLLSTSSVDELFLSMIEQLDSRLDLD